MEGEAPALRPVGVLHSCLRTIEVAQTRTSPPETWFPRSREDFLLQPPLHWPREGACCPGRTHADGSLAGGQGQPHQAGPVDGGEAVPDAEGPRALGGAPVQQVGDDGRGQQGAPAGLHQGHAQALAPTLLDAHLGGRHTGQGWGREGGSEGGWRGPRACTLTSLQFSLLEKWSRSPLWRWPGPMAPGLCWAPSWLGSRPLSSRNCLWATPKAWPMACAMSWAWVATGSVSGGCPPPSGPQPPGRPQG